MPNLRHVTKKTRRGFLPEKTVPSVGYF